MASASLVFPFDPSRPPPGTGGEGLVPRSRLPAQLPAAATAAGGRLRFLLWEPDAPLTALDPDPAWAGLPLYIRVPALGRAKDLMPRVRAWRALDPVVAFPETETVAPRILSSLGLRSAVELRGEAGNWDALADLASYALLTPVPHAPIEPFERLGRCYHPAGETRWVGGLLDEPARYLWLSEDGAVALSRAELDAGVFAAASLDDLGGDREPLALRARRLEYRAHLEQNDACGRCPAFRVCLGAVPRSEGCAVFFAEAMDLVEQTQALAQRRAAQEGGGPWRR